MSKRSAFHDYYARLNNSTSLSGYPIIQKSAAASSTYEFKGEKIEYAIVVRADINGYSNWSKDRSIADRVQLLNEFFTHLVPGLDDNGGIYFRDEGDCMVAIFSPYFVSDLKYKNIVDFCMHAVGRRYGAAKLSAKCTIASGNVAFFQKAHEVGTDDWSAEGQPFVDAARFEAAVESKPRICFFADDYNKNFDQGVSKAPPGGVYFWNILNESLQIQGLGLIGGWQNVVYLEHLG